MRRALGIIIVLLAIAGYGGWYGVQSLRADSSDMVRVDIPSGASVVRIAELLAEHHRIPSAWMFRLYVRAVDAAKDLKAGTYEIPPRLTVPEVVALLQAGETVSRDIRVTIPEGWTIAQIADRLTTLGFDGDEFTKVAQTPPSEWRAAIPVLRSLPNDASLEGYLFPETYQFVPEASAQDIAHTMVRQMDRVFIPAWYDAARARGMSVHQIVTLASIVEREVHKEEERPIVAGIFYNRLRDGIALGSDATLDYIFGESKVKHTLEETRVDSPYNTYKYPGLPPGPIGNPGQSALRATLFPKETKYFYFLNNAETQETVFSETFQEHVRNKKRNGL